MAASKTILNVSGHDKSVDIFFNKLEHDFDKQLIIIDKPVSSGSGGAHTDSDTLNVDLGRLKQIVSITNGWLIDETGSSAYTKKTDLEYIMSRKGNLSISWKVDDAGSNTTITKTCNIVKCKIMEVPGRLGDTTQVLNGTQTKMFMINIQFSVGEHKG